MRIFVIRGFQREFLGFCLVSVCMGKQSESESELESCRGFWVSVFEGFIRAGEVGQGLCTGVRS